jgi:hypothetical protein
MPTTIEFERLADETIETDAGSFGCCCHCGHNRCALAAPQIGETPAHKFR